MKKTALLFTICALFLSAFVMCSGCKKKTSTDEETYVPPPYSPSFLASATSYTSGGYKVLAFEIKCTTDDVEITSLVISGPSANATYTGNGEVFQKNQSIFLPDEFLYLEGKYSFTIKGIIKSSNNYGLAFTKITYWELIIP